MYRQGLASTARLLLVFSVAVTAIAFGAGSAAAAPAAPDAPTASIWCVDDAAPYDPGAPCTNNAGNGTFPTTFNTIQAAVNAATAGDEIRLAGGTYSAAVTFDKNLTVVGGYAGGNGGFTTPGTPASSRLSAGSGYIISNGVTVSMRNLTLAADLSGPGDLVIPADPVNDADTVNWDSGQMAGTGTTTVNSDARLVFNSGFQKELDERTLENSGTINANAGNFLMSNAATFNNLAGGSFNIQSDADINVTGSATINNAGTFSKLGGSGQTSVNPVFNNTGTLGVQSGQLDLRTGTSSSTLDIGTGAVLDFGLGGVYTISGGAVTGAGLLRNSSGTLTVNAAFTIPNYEQTVFGDLTGTGIVTITQGTWSGGEMGGTGTTRVPVGGTLTMNLNFKQLNQRTLENFGTINWSAGNLQFSNSTHVFNRVGGLFDVQTDVDLSGTGAGNSFTNQGTFRKSGAADITSVDVVFDNSGAVEVQSGQLQFLNGGTSTGSFDIANLTQIAVPFGSDSVYTFNAGATITGLGTFRVGEDIAVNTNLTFPHLFMELGNSLLTTTSSFSIVVFDWQGGRVEGNTANVVSLTQALNITGGSSKTLAGVTMNNLDTAAWTGGGTWNIILDAVFNNQLGATFSADSAADFGGTSDIAGTFNNAGTFTKTLGGDQLTVNDVEFNNSGTLNVQAGEFWPQAGGTNTGDIDVDPAAKWSLTTFAHDYSFNAGTSLTNDGPIEANRANLFVNTPLTFPYLILSGNGTVTGPSSFTVDRFDWNGGTLTATSPAAVTTVPAGGTFAMALNTKTLRVRTLETFANVLVTDNSSLTIGDAGHFINRAGATFEIQSSGGIFEGTGALGSFDNQGTFLKSTASTNTQISVPFNNSSIVRVEGGNLQFSFDGLYVQTAGETNLAGGTISNNQALQIRGGVLKGSGQVSGPINNMGGTVSPGASPGEITTTGNYTQSPTATLAIEIAGRTAGTFDRLIVNLTASLSGTLAVSVTNGFNPVPGDSWVILTASNRIGTFSRVTGTQLPSGLRIQVQYNPGDVTLFIEGGTPTSTATATRTNTPPPVITPPSTSTTGPTNTPPATSTPRPTQTPGGPSPTNTRRPTITPAATRTATSTRTPGGVPTATPTPCGLSFSDVHQTDFFYEGVLYLACHQVISGYADGTFRPYANTTRGQMTKIIVLAEGFALINPPTATFIDVPRTNPFYTYIETAVQREIISGYNDGTFRPFADVTRGQLCKILVVAAEWDLVDPVDPTFRDTPPENPFYIFIETAARHGVISGYADGSFRWFNNATRGQIAKIVHLAVTGPNLSFAQKQAMR